MPSTDITVKELGERIGQAIRELRSKSGLSQKELAEACHCTRKTVANYEGGKRTSFEGLVLLLRMSKALGVRIGDIVRPRS